uniref:Major facilitator superfamily (MFS) profile domain-containing protein n=1 Tax=Meloidogyne javanica TaxID=6303 RepID=A0A915MNA1_MELJA
MFLAIFLEIPELLIFGRIFAAVGSGLSFGSLILFIQVIFEKFNLLATKTLNGEGLYSLVISYIAVSVIGMGMGMDLMLGRNLLALVGFGAIPGILSIFIVLPLRESPKFLLLNRNDRKAAIKSLEFYQGKQPDNHQMAINEILKESDTCGHKRKEGGGQHNISLIKALIQILKQPHLRKAFIIGTLSLQIIAYGITYGAALGPIAFFITSELVPQRFRSLVQSIVFMTNTIINFVFSFITLPLYEIIDVWSFIPLFIIPSTISICYLIKELPETKGREIHEIVEQLKKGTKKKKKSGIIHPAAKGSIATADSSTTISDEENDDIEDFEEGIPDILLATTGHGKNSLIKTAAGSMAIAAAISKVIGGEQSKNKTNLTTITPIPEEKDEEEGKE